MTFIDLYPWNELDKFFNTNYYHFTGECCSGDGKNFVLTVELPGFKKDEVKLTVKNQVLKVEAENKKRSFSRSYQLPYEPGELADPEASLEDGILTVTFRLTKAGEMSIPVK